MTDEAKRRQRLKKQSKTKNHDLWKLSSVHVENRIITSRNP